MSTRPLANDKQIASMKKTWPIFRLKHRNGVLRWIGRNVKPQFQSYEIEISHSPHIFPIVRVLSPELTRLPGNSEGQLPHVYPPITDQKLCLFDPKNKEWNHSMLISKTIVPWTLDWLVCYELWLMTGKWVGGGRHEAMQVRIRRGI